LRNRYQACHSLKTLDIDAVDHLFHGREYLAGELQLSEAKSPALAWRAEPSKKKSDELPQRIETEAPGHHWIALEVTKEEPKVRLYVQLGTNEAFAVL